MKRAVISVLVVTCLVHAVTWVSSKKDFGFTRCKSAKDCGRDECCALTRLRENHIRRVCKKMLLSKERCYPNLFPGLSATCPCSPGLTCAVTGSDHSKKKRIFQCISVGSYQFKQENEERPRVLLEKIQTAKP